MNQELLNINHDCTYKTGVVYSLIFFFCPQKELNQRPSTDTTSICEELLPLHIGPCPIIYSEPTYTLETPQTLSNLKEKNQKAAESNQPEQVTKKVYKFMKRLTLYLSATFLICRSLELGIFSIKDQDFTHRHLNDNILTSRRN